MCQATKNARGGFLSVNVQGETSMSVVGCLNLLRKHTQYDSAPSLSTYRRCPIADPISA